MRIAPLLLTLLGLCTGSLATAEDSAGPGSQVFDALTIESEILGGTRKFAIYLPPGYDTSERSYPVLYLLHGAGDDQTGWVQFGEVQHITDREIALGHATPMVIIMPDANEGQRGYFNDPNGKWRYEDFFFKELMPHVEQAYRIKAEKRYRAVAGLSMGGGGTLMYAMHHPELFSSACPLSAYVGPLNLEQAHDHYKRFREAKDENAEPIADEVMEAWMNRHNAVKLAESLPEADLKSVRWYIDCGDEDFLSEGNALLQIALLKRKVPHEFRVRDGGHTWTYWRTSLPDVLKFCSDAFHQR